MKKHDFAEDLAKICEQVVLFEILHGFKLKVEVDIEGMQEQMESKKGRWYEKNSHKLNEIH